MPSTDTTAHPASILVRGQILHFLADPGPKDDPAAWEYFDDGALWIVDGRIHAAGPWEALHAALPPARRAAATYYDYRGRLVLPGLVDTHLHYAQAGALGSFGRDLLDWLGGAIFPAEASFADPGVAERTATFVADRLLAHGTTTASVFATVHAHSVDAFFAAAEARQMRVLCGKVLMDRHCPDALRDTAASGAADSLALIERWHGRGRLRYSLSPRFAPTSTPEQLQRTGELFAAWPDLHLQSHLAESHGERAWIARLFPGCRDDAEVYARYGLLGPRAIYAHALHLDDSQRRALAATGTAVAFCPSANLFLGSGFFDYAASTAAGLRVGLASDVGAGTSFSLIRSLGRAFDVSQATGAPLSALRGWFLATLGGAQALSLDDCIGSFQPGREADFVVLDLAATPELAWRMGQARSLTDQLFALMILGDERCVVATHLLGRRRWARP